MSIHKKPGTRKEGEGATSDWVVPVSFTALLVSLSVISFFLGSISSLAGPTQGIVIETVPPPLTPHPESNESQVGNRERSTDAESELLVGSVNSDIYHFPWCPGAQRISETNKRTFASYGEARAAGYRAAKNCEGLK